MVITTMEDAVSQLAGLGFSDAEARAYARLVASGPMTGYQLARAAGIPRPNVYPVLDRLEARGLVVRVHGDGGAALYRALPGEQMLARLSADMQGRIARAREALAGLTSQDGAARGVWNVEGRRAVLARAAAIIEGSRSRLLAGLWAAEALDLAPHLLSLESRGVTATVLCIQGCPDECGGCAGEVYRYPLGADPAHRWLIVCADEANVLVAQVAPDGAARGVETGLEVLCLLAAQHLRNAIAGAEIVRSLGADLPSLLDDHARRALLGTGLASAGQTWLDRLLEATATKETPDA
jgi:DNA-binding MarR family transcriptional regulator